MEKQAHGTLCPGRRVEHFGQSAKGCDRPDPLRLAERAQTHSPAFDRRGSARRYLPDTTICGPRGSREQTVLCLCQVSGPLRYQRYPCTAQHNPRCRLANEQKLRCGADLRSTTSDLSRNEHTSPSLLRHSGRPRFGTLCRGLQYCISRTPQNGTASRTARLHHAQPVATFLSARKILLGSPYQSPLVLSQSLCGRSKDCVRSRRWSRMAHHDPFAELPLSQSDILRLATAQLLPHQSRLPQTKPQNLSHRPDKLCS